MKKFGFILTLLWLAVGCDRQQPAADMPLTVTVTNVIEVTREVVVTNTVMRDRSALYT